MAEWKGHGIVYAVKPAQVSKTAQTGEYVGKGAFIVRAAEMVQGPKHENWTGLSQCQQHSHAHRWNP